MKHLIALSTLLFAMQIFGQDPIKIEERNENFSSGMQNSLVTNVPLGNQDLVEKVVKDEIKKFKGKVSGKEEFFVEQGTKTTVSEKPVDVYVKIIQVAGGKIEIAFAFNLGGAYLSKANHPDMYRKAEVKIHEIVKRIATEDIDLEVKEEEKKQKGLEKELDDLVKDKEKLEKSIEKNKEKIKKTNEEITVNKAAMDGKKKEIDELYKKEPIDAEVLKTLNKEQEKNMKESKRLHKTVSDCEADITKAENDIKSNLKAQEDKKGEIEKQKKYIEEEVKSKYSKIK